ncbi:MAG: T9SS type A sorting domain-containing protein [Bacteroidales bacterium]|nr:T9SS type A sorting domain-containing protein [Bacteroidales bacterium]
MNRSKLKTSLTIICFVCCSYLMGQDALIASGGNAKGNDGSVSYSVGQLAYTTNTSNAGSVAQGVQQPYEISVVTGLSNRQINLSVFVYPNPTTSKVKLQIDEEISAFGYKLFDSKGQLVETKSIKNSTTEIDLMNQANATYFLQVRKGNSEMKTFKIVKQ